MNLFDQDLGELQRQSDDLKKQKQMIQLAGVLGDAIGSAPSFGEVFLGRSSPRPNLSGAANAIASGMEDPLERQKNLLATYKASKDAKEETDLDHADSDATRSLYSGFEGAGVKIKPGLTGKQIVAAYGKPAEYMLSKFKEDQERKTKVAAANAKIPKGFMQRVDPATGSIEVVPMLGNYKQNQYQSGTYGVRALDADQAISKLMEDGFDPSSVSTGFQEAEVKIPFTNAGIGLPERFKSDDLKKYQSAQRDFILAKLRKESGATIRPEEEESERKTFFPQAGDSPEVKLQKARARQAVIAGLKAEASGAWDEILNQRNQIPIASVTQKEIPPPAGGREIAQQSQGHVPTREQALAELQKRKSMTALKR